MSILRKLITPAFLPILARAQWALAADIMRRAAGGDLISRTALHKFRELASSTDDLVELVELTGSGEIYVVSFYDFISQTHHDRALIEWAVEDYRHSEWSALAEYAETLSAFLAEWDANPWQEWSNEK